jgi:hypothetical protein
MSTQTIQLSLVVLLGATSLGCGAAEEQDSRPTPPAVEVKAEHGSKFTDVSALLEPFKRVGLDGLYGLAWIDYDVDSDLDLLVPGGVGFENAFFENRGDGTFTDVTQQAGLTSTSGYSGVAVGDLDNDGYPDIFASAEGNDFFDARNSPSLFRNNGDGTFTDVIAESGILATRTAAGVTMGDVNNDGYLDIFLASSAHRRELFPPARYDPDQLFINNGDFTFTDVTEEAGVVGGEGSCVATFSDYDDDDWIDLWVGVCNDVDDRPTPFYLYRNNRDGTFTDVATEAGLNERLGYWMAITFGDIENDGDLDMFSTNYGPVDPEGNPAPHVLFVNNGDGTYSGSRDERWLNTFAFGASFGDWDNDQWSDLYVVGSQPFGGYIGAGLGTPGYVYFNDQRGELTEDTSAAGTDMSHKYTSGLAKGDFDADGFVDLAVAVSAFDLKDPETGTSLISDDGAPVLLHNEGNGNHWVTLRLRGTESNRMAIGAKLRLETADGVRQYQETHAGESFISAESPWPTFGLGGHETALLEVTWPSRRREWFSVASDRIVDIEEGSGSSMKPTR